MRTPPATMGVVSKAGKLFGQFRQKRDVKDVSQLIQPGDMLPEAIVEVSADGRQMKLADVMGTSSGMSLLVGMPGAFTPTCSTCHLPSLVEAAPRLEKAPQPRLLDLAHSSPRPRPQPRVTRPTAGGWLGPDPRQGAPLTVGSLRHSSG